MKLHTKKQIRRIARRALLAFKEEVPVLALPMKFRCVNPLFRVAHLSRFDKPLPARLN